MEREISQIRHAKATSPIECKFDKFLEMPKFWVLTMPFRPWSTNDTWWVIIFDFTKREDPKKELLQQQDSEQRQCIRKFTTNSSTTRQESEINVYWHQTSCAIKVPFSDYIVNAFPTSANIQGWYWSCNMTWWSILYDIQVFMQFKAKACISAQNSTWGTIYEKQLLNA